MLRKDEFEYINPNTSEDFRGWIVVQILCKTVDMLLTCALLPVKLPIYAIKETIELFHKN